MTVTLFLDHDDDAIVGRPLQDGGICNATSPCDVQKLATG
jgi:hypothetical protein